MRTDSARAALPLTLVIIGTVTIFWLRSIGVPGTPDALKIKMADAQEFRAFVVWAITFAALIVAAVWAAVAALSIARKYLPRRAFTVSVVVCVVMAALVAVASRYAWDDRGLLAIVERARPIPVRYVTLVGNALAVGSAMMVVAACIALATSHEALTIPHLRRRIAESRLLFFSAALFLVVGVAEIDSVFQLPAAVSRARIDPEGLKVIQHVSRSMTLIAGLLYTSVLLVLFVPVAVVHEKWIDDLWQAAPTAKHSEWLEATGLSRSIGATSSQMIAAAGPFLAALGLS